MARGRCSKDRLRTIWMPEMDHYFIDLMLEQVRRGNMVDDHLFSKRAWNHMTSLFNAKFKFQYEKDVLKNRHKTLRNLYKAVNNLLEQEGFSWDEARQMVTADNKVWDDYIKEHPDARSYRIKSIPNYSGLCEIYKTTEGKGDRSIKAAKHENHMSSTSEVSGESLHDIMIDEDYQISISKETVYGSPQIGVFSASSTRSRTCWQPPMDRYFVDLMLDQVRKGNQVDGIFRKQAWIEMISSFNTRFGFNYEIDVLKNRYKTLRKQCNVIKNLLELDGFFWDDSRQMVTAEDRVWQDYIKAHTDARQYMTRPVPYYKDLCTICRELSADARDSLSGNNLYENPEVKLMRRANDPTTPDASVSSRDLFGDENYENKHRMEKNPLGSVSPRKARSISSNDGDEGGMASTLREMANAVSCSNTIPIENVVGAIQALPDMDEELVLDACDFLEDDKMAKTFLALDVKLRKKWLLRKLRPTRY